jgi:hypothetical protein
MPAHDGGAAQLGAGVGKTPREETAGEGLKRRDLHYGDLSAATDGAGRRRGDPAKVNP